MTNNQLTENSVNQLLNSIRLARDNAERDDNRVDHSFYYALTIALEELQERRKADSEPLVPVVDSDDNFYSWFGREWHENYQHNQYTTAAKQMLGVMAESAWKAGRRAAMLQAEPVTTPNKLGNSPVIPDTWIPVSERMPGSQEWVIVFAKWANQQILCWDDAENRWTDFEDQSYHAAMFTHWMPLPAATKEVK